MKCLVLNILVLTLFHCCTAPKRDKPLVVCTTAMIGEFASLWLEDIAEVNTLFGPGVDPHIYKPTQGDMVLLEEAVAIVSNGLHLEGKMEEVLKALSSKKKVIYLSEALAKVHLIAADSKGTPDPHIWLDASLWAKALKHLAMQLSIAFPEQENIIKSRADLSLQQIKALDSLLLEMSASIPKSKRVMVTTHDAFQYFGRRYSIEVIALQGVSTAAEYGLQDMKRVVEAMVERNIPALFAESTLSKKALNAIIESCASKGHKVQIGGTLYSDAYGDAESNVNHYQAMLMHNMKTIVKAMQHD